MQALKLELSAFGPYRERQVIDFTVLGAEPIFLITGPTGAGKTTIFDAICYSLYGKASGTERDQEAFRSHFAEMDEATGVTFTFQLQSTVYRVMRNPKQLKRKARGEGFTEEVAAASLYRQTSDQDWELISSKINDVNKLIETMIGLDYEQFKKMIMIPQGEFRKLISENSREREEVLQKIFRTYFYRQMTEKLKDKARDLREEIEKLDWQYQQLLDKLPDEWLNDESDQTAENQLQIYVQQLTLQRQQGQQQEQELTKQIKQLQETYIQEQQLLDYFEEHQQLLKQQEELAARQDMVNRQQQQLEWAKKAERIRPAEQSAKTREQEWYEQVQKLKQLKGQQLKKDQHYQQVKESYDHEKKRDQERTDLQFKLKKQQELLAQMDQFQAIYQEMIKIEEDLAKKQEVIQAKETQLEKLDQCKEQVYQDRETLQTLKEQLFELRQHLEQLKQDQKQIEELETVFQSQQQLTEQRGLHQQQLSEVQSEWKKQEKIAKELEQQQKAHLASFLASQLESGQECPVCGSLEHPHPAQSEAFLQTNRQQEEQQQLLRKLQEKLRKAELAVIESKQQIQAGQEQMERLQEQVLTNDQSAIKQRKQQIEGHWKQRQQTYQQLEAQQQHVEQRLQANQQQLAVMDDIKQQLKETEQASKVLNDQRLQYHARYQQMKQQLPDEAISVEEFQQQVEQLEAQVHQEIAAWDKLQEQLEQATADKNKIDTAHNEAVKYHDQLKGKWEEAEAQLADLLKQSDFSSIEDYQKALMDTKQQQTLEADIQTYQQDQNFVHNRLEAVQLQVEGKEKPDLSILDVRIQALSEKKDGLNKTLQFIDIQLEQLQTTITQTKQLAADRALLEKEYLHVGELADLARGDNSARLSFERFVLSTFLDEILLQANIRLSQMTDHRFQLLRSEALAKRGAQSGLDLEVLDHYTGKQRSVKTLSGGEGFKTALSLALGMSDIVQTHAGGVQLDTLFIDEGFGTLDEVSLEQAIKCLKDLQQDHRTIGVISHVAQLKEEIKAKLIIETSPTGSRAAFSFD
ncbi:AAA family ATPase [Gracilibacillus alcaliphilus]|uniref:AAA family ATPase n=1 Tax=Gracilibacillus alcaliphilus TaxID=1401441 RepID=UPI00195863F8|nr:SMC family ATPase [Gracilibacillus alcaliphilus]MBM7675259.1 exonuclease SbcC [Gracilibacillus alcaliphilus]